MIQKIVLDMKIGNDDDFFSVWLKKWFCVLVFALLLLLISFAHLSYVMPHMTEAIDMSVKNLY